MIRPNAHAAYIGVLSEVLDARAQGSTLIVESGILGGDLIPRAFLEPTLKQIQSKFDGIAAETDDDVDVRMVGSSRFGAENRAVFGDIDLIVRMKKPETLSRIKEWVGANAMNVRDIASKTHGKDLDIKKLGNQFSFLFPIYREGAEPLTIGELRAILQARHGHTNWKDHHDERLRVQTNIGNLANKSGQAMVQIDVMHVLVDGADVEDLSRRAKKLADRLEGMQLDNKAELAEWLKKTLDGEDVEDFETHYEFLRNHGEMQTNDDQQVLAAVYYLKNREKHGEHINNRWANMEHRYSLHPDSLQIIYFLASQVGMPLDNDSFNKDSLQQIVSRCIQAGITNDKLTVEMLRSPMDAFKTIKGKFKDEAKKYIISNTKNKRADEHNPHALWKNLGTRDVKRV